MHLGLAFTVVNRKIVNWSQDDWVPRFQTPISSVDPLLQAWICFASYCAAVKRLKNFLRDCVFCRHHSPSLSSRHNGLIIPEELEDICDPNQVPSSLLCRAKHETYLTTTFFLQSHLLRTAMLLLVLPEAAEQSLGFKLFPYIFFNVFVMY